MYIHTWWRVCPAAAPLPKKDGRSYCGGGGEVSFSHLLLCLQAQLYGDLYHSRILV